MGGGAGSMLLIALGCNRSNSMKAEIATGRTYGVITSPNTKRIKMEVSAGCDALNKMIPVTKSTAASGLFMTEYPTEIKRAGHRMNFQNACISTDSLGKCSVYVQCCSHRDCVGSALDTSLLFAPEKEVKGETPKSTIKYRTEDI